MITLNDIFRFEVNMYCKEQSPCGHHSVVILNDGRQATGLNSFEIWSLVSTLAPEKIVATEKNIKKDIEEVSEHFSRYSKPKMGFKMEAAEVVLNKLFNKG